MVYPINENYMWVVKHAKELDKHPGKWVAIDEGRLISIADTLKELADRTEVKAAKHPLFHLVPTIEESNGILIL